jgi:hypothetical protein
MLFSPKIRTIEKPPLPLLIPVTQVSDPFRNLCCVLIIELQDTIFLLLFGNLVQELIDIEKAIPNRSSYRQNHRKHLEFRVGKAILSATVS